MINNVINILYNYPIHTISEYDYTGKLLFIIVSSCKYFLLDVPKCSKACSCY